MRFREKGFSEPFYAQKMSDGTLRLLAYFLMLNEKEPRSLVFIEEPENGLHHQYLTDLAVTIKESVGSGYTRQLFATTHSPFFVNALTPDEVWVLEKAQDGFSGIRRATEYPFVKDLTDEDIELGDLWYSRYFD